MPMRTSKTNAENRATTDLFWRRGIMASKKAAEKSQCLRGFARVGRNLHAHGQTIIK